MNEELSKYLKIKKGLNRLFIKLKDKYISLGRYSGIVILNNITKDESIDIGNLLGKKLNEGDNLKTSFNEITKKILETKYRDFDWKELLNNYFNEKIISKKEQLELNDKNESIFFKSIIDNNQNNKYINILKEIITKKEDIYRILKQRYNKDKKTIIN